MRLYLDMCALKRPFDDRSQQRVDAEAQAVLEILERIASGAYSLVWSPALTFENAADPDNEARELIAELGLRATTYVSITSDIERRIRNLRHSGLGALDAAHLALAEAAQSDVVLTCDDRFAKRALQAGTSIRIVNPLEFLMEMKHDKAAE